MPEQPTKRMRLRYDGTCTVCGIDIAKGEWGIYVKATKTVHCPEHDPDTSAPEATSQDPTPDGEPRRPLDGLKRLKTRRDGTCALCGAAVPQGTDAWWHPTAKTLVCPPCKETGPGAVVGVAGAGAAREHERRQAKVQDRLVRRHPIMGRITLAFRDDIPDSWSRGAIGEQVVGKALNAVAGPSCIVLHDRKIPGSVANIDHLIVAASGIWVIDAKRYRGKRPEIRDRGTFFRPDKRLYVGRDCTKLIDGLDRQMAAVARALGPLFAQHGPSVTAALTFVDADWGWFPPDSFRGVRIEGPKSIVKAIRAPGPLTEDQITELAFALAIGLPPGN